MFLIFVSAVGSAEVDGASAEGKPLENTTNFAITHLPPSSEPEGCVETAREWAGSEELVLFGLRGLSSFPAKDEKGGADKDTDGHNTPPSKFI